jgi:hypothetical protein
MEIQEHTLKDGSVIEISRDVNHQYRVNNGPKMSNVTSMTHSLIDGDTFGIAVRWATNIIRDTNNFDGALLAQEEGRMGGERLHSAVQDYIDNGVISEDSETFVAWLQTAGKLEQQGLSWVTSERFVYHPDLNYAGTVDALSIDLEGNIAIWDWKTKQRDSWERNGPYLSEQAQLAAYATALKAMGSRWVPTKAYIMYVMRDGSYTDTREVDIKKGMELFLASQAVYNLVKERSKKK